MLTVSFDLVTFVIKEDDRAGKLMDWVFFTLNSLLSTAKKIVDHVNDL